MVQYLQPTKAFHGLGYRNNQIARNISPYSVRMRKNARKIRTRITPNTDTFYAVLVRNPANIRNVPYSALLLAPSCNKFPYMKTKYGV